MPKSFKIKVPRGDIKTLKAFNILKAFSDDTIYSAAIDIIFSIDLDYKEEYTFFINKLVSLIKEPQAKIRIEQACISQIKILEKRRDRKGIKEKKEYNIPEVFDNPDIWLVSLSGNHELQLAITNYILDFFKSKDFIAFERCLDILIDKNVLLNTVKSFIKKELQHYIDKHDISNLKRIRKKYASNDEIRGLIEAKLNKF